MVKKKNNNNNKLNKKKIKTYRYCGIAYALYFYLFIFQGFFIFLFHGFLNKQVNANGFLSFYIVLRFPDKLLEGCIIRF